MSSNFEVWARSRGFRASGILFSGSGVLQSRGTGSVSVNGFAALDAEDLAIFWDDFEKLSGSRFAVLMPTSCPEGIEVKQACRWGVHNKL